MQTLPETVKGGPRSRSVGGGPTAGEAGTQGFGAGPRRKRVGRGLGGGAMAREGGAQGLGRGHGGEGGAALWGRRCFG